MARLELALSNLDLVALGLPGAWGLPGASGRPPDWLRHAIEAGLTTDAGAVLAVARQLHLEGLLDELLTATRLRELCPPSMDRALEARKLESETTATSVMRAAQELDGELASRSVTPTYFKGAVNAARYYRTPVHRHFRDLDLRVSAAETAVVISALAGLGYQPGEFVASKGIVRDVPRPGPADGYAAGTWTKVHAIDLSDEDVELLSASGAPYHLDGSKLFLPVEIDLHFLLDPDARLSFESVPAPFEWLPHGRVLAIEADLVFLAYKAYVDLVILGERSGTKLLADTLRLLAEHGDEIDWDRVMGRAHSTGVCAPLRYLVSHAATLYGLTVVNEVPTCPCSRDIRVPFDIGDFIPALTNGLSPLRFVA
jgi:hypothetical protein